MFNYFWTDCMRTGVVAYGYTSTQLIPVLVLLVMLLRWLIFFFVFPLVQKYIIEKCFTPIEKYHRPTTLGRSGGPDTSYATPDSLPSDQFLAKKFTKYLWHWFFSIDYMLLNTIIEIDRL